MELLSLALVLVVLPLIGLNVSNIVFLRQSRARETRWKQIAEELLNTNNRLLKVIDEYKQLFGVPAGAVARVAPC